MASPTQVKTVTVDNSVNVFYREASPTAAKDPSALPVVVLLHGFPSSSFQYRNLIPILATKYRVVAPDLPGYGFTVVPEGRKYQYTFESITNTIAAFLDALEIKEFSVYIFDYGAPTALRCVACPCVTDLRGLVEIGVQARTSTAQGNKSDHQPERERVRRRVGRGFLGSGEEAVGRPIEGELRSVGKGHQLPGHQVAGTHLRIGKQPA